MNARQHIRAVFLQTTEGLVAQNECARILLSPVQGFDGDYLAEATECNCLIRPRNGETLSVFIDDRPAEAMGFLRDGHALWGRLATGDHPGHIRFCIRAGDADILYAELEVRPSRLDYETDYHIMRGDLQRVSRELLYSLPNHAQIATHLTDAQGGALDFHQVIAHLLNHLVRTMHAIVKRPDRHLKTAQRIRPVDRATGSDPQAISHLIRSPQFWTSDTTRRPYLPDGIGYTHVRETHRHPDIDTPRNRHLVAHLERVSRRAQTIADTALGHRLKTNVNRFLRSLPLSPARRGDPVPGHLDARYQTAFALIRALDRALDPCVGGPFDLSYRDTHVLYEYWIYFALIQALRDLGFAPTSDRNLFRLTERGLRVSPTQGEPSAIHLQRGACHIRCLYNPTYSTASGRALTHDLRPDIVIEIHTAEAGHPRAIHAFDAKYRREDRDGVWIPMREDIDKMHAYRDAIGQVTGTDFQRILKSAIVLFPSPANPAYHTHAFYTSLPHGIGGLPLLPRDAKTASALRAYLAECVLE